NRGKGGCRLLPPPSASAPRCCAPVRHRRSRHGAQAAHRPTRTSRRRVRGGERSVTQQRDPCRGYEHAAPNVEVLGSKSKSWGQIWKFDVGVLFAPSHLLTKVKFPDLTPGF